MNTADCIANVQSSLAKAGVETARLDALLLLSDVTGKNKPHLLAHPELELMPQQQSDLEKLVARRVRHEPLAYIRGKSEFYGREFLVNQHVLVPRPDSETIIYLLKSSVTQPARGQASSRSGVFGQEMQIIDVGTGSGALAITARLELPDAEVYGLDVDPACLEVAKKNAQKHSSDVTFLQSDLLGNLPITNYQLPITILANLPYVPDDYEINQAATHEPKIALFGGPDGLDLYRTLFAHLAGLSNKAITVFTESLGFQHKALTEIAEKNGFTLKIHKDLVQVFTKTSKSHLKCFGARHGELARLLSRHPTKQVSWGPRLYRQESKQRNSACRQNWIAEPPSLLTPTP